MKTALKKIKDCKVRLNVEVEPELVEGRFQEVFRAIQRSARLPGFRDGKAPLDMIEKKFEREAHEEVLKSLIPDAYHQSVAKEKVTPVTLPAISEIKMERGKTLTFAAEFERSPEFNLKNYKGIRLRKVPVDVTEDDMQKAVSSLKDAKAEMKPIDAERPVQKGDFIVADVDVFKNGAYAPGRKGVLLFVESNEADDFFDKIVGVTLNEVREVRALPTEDEKKQGILAGKELYKIWVRAIHEKKLPEFDAAFAKAFGKETPKELSEAIRKDIFSYKESEAREKTKEELFEKLLGLVSFELPAGLVEKQRESMVERAKRHSEKAGMSPEAAGDFTKKIETESAEKAKNQVKLYFILQKVAELEGIDVDEVELEKKLAALAAESERSIDEARRVFEDDLREGMAEKATIDFLLANAKFEDTKGNQ